MVPLSFPRTPTSHQAASNIAFMSHMNSIIFDLQQSLHLLAMKLNAVHDYKLNAPRTLFYSMCPAIQIESFRVCKNVDIR